VARCTAVVAVATRYDTLTHDRPGERAMEPGEAMKAIRDLGGTFWPAATTVLERLVQREEAEHGRPARNPGGLTDREAEVLRYVAAGLSRRAIADRLVISESTARSHLEHIYRKIGVSTRVGAALFAVENGLVS
jgi:DNA-binding NarL/FixJ family response regulator